MIVRQFFDLAKKKLTNLQFLLYFEVDYAQNI